jgi:hypothetical protein
MGHITISGNAGARRTVAAAFWIAVGLAAVIVFGDALTLLALALAIVTVVCWIFREVEHRLAGNDAHRYVTGLGSRKPADQGPLGEPLPAVDEMTSGPDTFGEQRFAA